MTMIDHKLSQHSRTVEMPPNKMNTSTMTTSSSFTHLSMDDTDELSMNDIEVQPTIQFSIKQTPTETKKTPSTSTTTDSFVLYDALADICQNNIKYFECDETEIGQRFLCAFRGIIDHLIIAREFVTKIVQFVHEYDFDERTPANGYRSFVKASQSCINHSVKISKFIAQNRSYLLFRKNMYMK